MFWGKGDLVVLKELGTDGEQVPVKHDGQDRIRGGLLRSGNEEQREGLNEHSCNGAGKAT